MTNLKPANHSRINGTSLQGYIDISYTELVEKLGPPHTDGDGYKVDAEWILELPSGNVATIYNYKTGHNYNKGRGLAVEEIRDWHIGGHHATVVAELHKALCKRPPEAW